MRNPFLAVLLSVVLGPGVGQLYNRDFKKGFILIGLSFLLVLSLVLSAEYQPPPDLGVFDYARTRQWMDELMKKNSSQVITFQLLMFATWLYSVVDAYLGAKEDKTAPDDSSRADDDPPEED